MKMNLLIISHTPHYKRDDGVIVGWGPTIREIDCLTEIFSTIYHIAPLYSSEPPASSIAYSCNVNFVALRPTGGERLADKFSIIFQSWGTIRLVGRYLKMVDCFQFRAPTGIGVYLIPWLSLLSGKRGWFKYAGNWVANDLPPSYRLQRFYLKRLFTKRTVTINGTWKNQPKHVVGFENPALTDEEVTEGRKASLSKEFDDKLILLFVGRVEKAKGLSLLLEMLSHCSPDTYKELIVVGEGRLSDFSNSQNLTSIPVRMLGGLHRERINGFYAESHILILPSMSEGFPKVVAEAAAYGCVPAVFNISAIGQYINNTNGLLFTEGNPEVMAKELSAFCENRQDLKKKSMAANLIASKFTYSHYNQRIRDILSHE